jgi:cystathionine beta-lyase/cystathionine gamma-synthase
MTEHNRHAFATRAVHGGGGPDEATGAVSVPIYATSTYAQESPGIHKGYAYGRSRNPTRDAVERCIADLENGSAGFAFASGSAATATVLECLDHGAHVIATDDLYGGTFRLIDGATTQFRAATQSGGHDGTGRRCGGDPSGHAVDLGRDADQSHAEAGRSERDRGAWPAPRHLDRRR